MDMYFPYLSPNSARPTNAVFWCGFGASMRTCESAAVERIGLSTTFRLDAGAVSFQPVPIRNSLLAMPTPSGDCGYFSRSNYLADSWNGTFDVSSSSRVAEHSTRHSILPDFCRYSDFVLEGNAPLLPAIY